MVAHWVGSLSKSRIELATDAKKEKERKIERKIEDHMEKECVIQFLLGLNSNYVHASD